MKIIHEIDGGEEYFDIILTERELKDILLYKGMEQKTVVKKRPISIYIRRGEHAAIPRQEQEDD